MSLRRWIVILLLCSTLIGCNNPWSSGDRVLVSKGAYDFGVTGPRRYDVVVFKYPGKGDGEGPVKNGTPTNYIKRLLGLPGELLAIFFGRIYRWTPPENAPPPFDDLKDGKVEANQLRKRDYMHVDDKTSREWFEKGQFEILRKPTSVMLAMRRIVYDNDYQPADLKNFPRWKPNDKSAWKNDGATGFACDGPDGAVDWLHYQHLVRKGNLPEAERKLITDSLAYNNFKSAVVHRDERGNLRRLDVADRTQQLNTHWVGDLMIECNVEVVQAKGDFLLELNKGSFRYQARFDLASGQCHLKSIDLAGNEKDLGNQPTTVKSPGTYMLRLANIDARLAVWVDRSLPFGDGVDYEPPEVRGVRGPQKNDLTRPASVGCKGASVKVSHLRVWRDSYYTTSFPLLHDSADYTAPASWSDSTDWDSTIRKARYVTFYVQPGHYLCLGDNSQQSSDSRDWGVVPERLMLGRALVVYYPLDRMGLIR